MANPSSNDIFTQFSLDLQSATQGVPGFVPAQCLIGQVEFLPEQEFYADVAKNGYYFIIGMPDGSGSYFNFEGEFEVTGELLYPVPADLSYNWTAPNAMIAAMIAGWAHWTEPGTSGSPDYQGGSQWTRGQNRSPVKFKFGKPEIRHYEKQWSCFLAAAVQADEAIQAFIVSTKFTFTMPFVTDQAANPYISPIPS